MVHNARKRDTIEHERTPFLGVIASLSAVFVETGEVSFRPGPQERSVPERFRLEPAVFRFELEPVMATTRYTVSKLRFPSPIETPDALNNVVHAEYFAPRRLRFQAARGDCFAHPRCGFSLVAAYMSGAAGHGPRSGSPLL